MIKVGIIGSLQDEGQIYQTLHNSKEVEPTGLYNPGRDIKSDKFKIFHNPIELLEISDAILIYNSENISADFISLMIRKSKHIFFRRPPHLSISEIAILLKLQKEAGSVIHLFNQLLAAKPGVIAETGSGIKIINLQLGVNEKSSTLSAEMMNAFVFLCKLENSSVKHSEVLGLKNDKSQITVNIHSVCSNGSVHNILLSFDNINSEIQIFQKNNLIRFEIPNEKDIAENVQTFDDFAFQSFISCIGGKPCESIGFEDFYNSMKTYLDISEKLNYSGIDI